MNLFSHCHTTVAYMKLVAKICCIIFYYLLLLLTKTHPPNQWFNLAIHFPFFKQGSSMLVLMSSEHNGIIMLASFNVYDGEVPMPICNNSPRPIIVTKEWCFATNLCMTMGLQGWSFMVSI